MARSGFRALVTGLHWEQWQRSTAGLHHAAGLGWGFAGADAPQLGSVGGLQVSRGFLFVFFYSRAGPDAILTGSGQLL